MAGNPEKIGKLANSADPERVEGWAFAFAPSPAGAIPSEVFTTERTLNLNGSQIVLKHYAPAHTDSDISVQFADFDVVHVGDTFWNGLYPFIDYSTGENIDGMIRATASGQRLRLSSPFQSDRWR